jgi:transposase
VFYGSIKDIKTIRHFLDRFACVDLGFIFDRGFSSYKLLLELKAGRVHYVVPLKKNSKLLAEPFRAQGALVYRKRSVGFSKQVCAYGFLYLFDDPSIRAEEEHVLFGKVEAGKLSVLEYEVLRQRAGVFGLVSDLDCSAAEVYSRYKDREEVELCFDVLKDELEADKTYLRCEGAVRGYFVVVFLALRLRFKILGRLRERGLVGKISVREVLYELSKIELSVEENGREVFCAFPKRAQEILSIFSDLIPMGYT